MGEILGPSCPIFSGTVAPSNYIYGGEVRLNETDELSTIIEVKSYQIGAYTDSPYSIARKVKIAKGECKYTATFGLSCPEITSDELEEAELFLDEYLLDFIDFMKDYAKELNDDNSKLFNIVFWTPV